MPLLTPFLPSLPPAVTYNSGASELQFHSNELISATGSSEHDQCMRAATVLIDLHELSSPSDFIASDLSEKP